LLVSQISDARPIPAPTPGERGRPRRYLTPLCNIRSAPVGPLVCSCGRMSALLQHPVGARPKRM
jgi:hypothetical protein